ncbi:MAG: methionine synthase [Chromatocurvus sp.]
MTQQDNSSRDSAADAIAATAIITIVVVGMAIWLSGMPS